MKRTARIHTFLQYTTMVMLATAATWSSPVEASSKGLTKQSLGKLLQQRKRRFLPCYKRALTAAPGLEGRLHFSFEINPKGQVQNASIKRSQLAHAALHRCLLKELKGWSFPARAQKLKVTYPLHLTPGAPTSNKTKLGLLTKQQIQGVIGQEASKRKMKQCYERALKKHPTLKGKVVLSFVIAKSGLVQRANIKRGNLRHNGVKRCLLYLARSWKFPKPKGNGIVQVTYPFSFHP